jgi:uncharacterized BrkB/YihY/UPF0761 family membrane protein
MAAMSPLNAVRGVIGAADRFQRRHRWAGVPYAVQQKFGDDSVLVMVALAWYGFTAIFPLLLVVMTLPGFIGAQSVGAGLERAACRSRGALRRFGSGAF